MSNSDIFGGYSDHYDAEVRLVILKALDDEDSKTLNDSMLHTVLKTFAIRRTREYLGTQLRWMEREASAVRLTTAGSAVIAHLTQQGADHLSRDGLIVGIKPPSLPR